MKFSSVLKHLLSLGSKSNINTFKQNNEVLRFHISRFSRHRTTRWSLRRQKSVNIIVSLLHSDMMILQKNQISWIIFINATMWWHIIGILKSLIILFYDD